MDMCICTVYLVIYMCILFMAGSEIRLYTESIVHSKGSYIEQSSALHKGWEKHRPESLGTVKR
jgi:hypothetical protein